MTLHIGFGANLRLSLTGELLGGVAAAEVGIVTHLVEANKVMAKAMEVAEALAAMPPTAMRLTKHRLRAMTQPGFDAACVFVIKAQTECYASGEPQVAQKKFLANRRVKST